MSQTTLPLTTAIISRLDKDIADKTVFKYLFKAAAAIKGKSRNTVELFLNKAYCDYQEGQEKEQSQ